MTNIEKLASLYIKDINEKYELSEFREKFQSLNLETWNEKRKIELITELITNHYWSLFDKISSD